MRDSFLVAEALSSSWPGSEVMLPMLLSDWPACVRADPDRGQLVSDKVVTSLLVSWSVPTGRAGVWVVKTQDGRSQK